MATTAEENNEGVQSKKRKTKDLPECLAYLNEANFKTKLKTRLETDNKDKEGEVMVAYKVMLEEGVGTFDLNTLTLDQMRKLCKNVGVRYVNKCNKFQCRKALWVLAEYQNQKEMESAQNYTTASEKMTNNIVRITNIIFSHDFLESFLALNDIKTRVDHETHDLPKHFWDDVAEAMNGSDDDDSSALEVVLSPQDNHFDEIDSLNLHDFDIMTSSAIKKKVCMLFKIRKVIQENMTVSGEHDSDPYNFVEVAMKKVGRVGMSLLGCYYFFRVCDKNPEADVRYSVEIDDILRGGNTETSSNADSDGPSSNIKKEAYQNEKKRAYAAMADISDVAKNIAAEMKETNRLAQESTDALKEKNRLVDEKNRLARQAQLIAVAQHLGKHEILENLLASFSSSSG